MFLRLYEYSFQIYSYYLLVRIFSCPRRYSIANFENRVSARSTTMPISCPRSQWLFQHVSVQSTTTPTRCQQSQRLRGHAIFEIYNYIFATFIISFLFFQCKIIYRMCSQRPRGYTFFRKFWKNIFAKTKNFAKSFLPVHMGSRWSFYFIFKKCWKSHDTVPLS